MLAYHTPYTYNMYFILMKAACLLDHFRRGSIPIGFHRFTEIGEIFHNKYIFSEKL